MELFEVEREDWDYDEETSWVVAAGTASQAKKHVVARIAKTQPDDKPHLKARRMRYREGVLFAAVHHG